MSGKAEKNRLYKVLEVSPDAGDAEIKKAYRKLAMVSGLVVSGWGWLTASRSIIRIRISTIRRRRKSSRVRLHLPSFLRIRAGQTDGQDANDGQRLAMRTRF